MNQYKNFKFLHAGIDTTPHIYELGDNKWLSDTYLRDYPQGPFGDTESVIMRFPPRSVVETEEALKEYQMNIDQHENVWQPIANELPQLKNLAMWLMNAVGGTRLGRVLINKVKPDGHIYAHADTPVHALYWSRFHIVLYAKPGNDFHCGDEMVNMETGEIWYFRNDLIHEVINNSNDVRIHMVIDIKCEHLDFEKAKPVAIPTEVINIQKPIYGKGITYQVEKVKDCYEELLPFVPLHWAELGLTQNEVPVNMDWTRYFRMEKDGALHFVTVRDNGKLIGYHWTIVHTHFHYKTTLHGQVDLYYILPEYRNGRTGLRLFQFAEQELKKIGVKKIITGCKVHLDHTRLFEHLGYVHSDHQFYKLIKE